MIIRESKVKSKSSKKSARIKTRSYKACEVSPHAVASHKKEYTARANAYMRIYAQEQRELELMSSGLQRFAEK